MELEIQKNLRHNLIVNLLDGGFFGFAIGFTSFVTVIPLFVSQMTDSAVLIGLIPAIHNVGWQLPQLFTAKWVRKQRQIKPLVLVLTTQERLPFLGLALIAFFRPQIGNQLALWITYTLLIWQGLGGGLTANAWQTMIGKIMPADRRGTFYGAQSSAANLLASLSAVIAGYFLSKLSQPLDFTACFLSASIMMIVSWIFLSRTREPNSNLPIESTSNTSIYHNLVSILKKDHHFRGFIIARNLSQLAVMSFAFYTVYLASQFHVSKIALGGMTAIFLATQIVANPVMGWLGDQLSHNKLMAYGIGAAVASVIIAWFAPHANWFFLVFMLAGIANVAVWTLALAATLEYGTEVDRPTYIGLANTLIAPMTFVAPLMAGWIVDFSGYHTMFFFAAIAGVVTLVVFQILIIGTKSSPIE